jgi:NNP family nitrate/nitrite transporter-like MFS transporter
MVLFSRFTSIGPATVAFLLFGLMVCMACGTTFAIVPLLRPKAVGSVSGIVGAGGNVGAVLAALLFKSDRFSGANAFLVLGGIVTLTSCCALLLRFRHAAASPEVEQIDVARSLDQNFSASSLMSD